MKKILLIIIDGLGDKPIPQLGNKTPLEAAKTPNLDFFAKEGICGQLEPFLLPEEKYPSSEVTHLALLGFDPKKYYQGRGVYEALGAGIKLRKSDISLRANFASVDENLIIKDRRTARIEKTEKLIKTLNKIKIPGVKILVKKSFGHRAVLVFRGKNLNPKISSNDPKLIGIKPLSILPESKSKEAEFTAKILNQFLEISHQILKEHPFNKKREKEGKLPANYLLVRGAGSFKKTLTFKEKFKLKPACIDGRTLYKGIAKALGMDLIKVKKDDSIVNTNLKGKILAAKRALNKFDFIFLHIKAADSLAEDGNFKGKQGFIEKIDKALKSILDFKNILIVITADHSTCCALKRHCLESIPILIYGDGKDLVKQFSEKACQKGKLGRINQLSLMPKILRIASS